MKRIIFVCIFFLLCFTARAQQINTVTLVLNPRNPNVKTSQTGPGALAAILNAIPAGSTAQVIVGGGYTDYISALTVPDNTTITFSRGSFLAISAPNTTMFSSIGAHVTMDCSQGGTFDGQYAAHGYTGTVAIHSLNISYLKVTDCVFQNFDGQAIVGGTFTGGAATGSISWSEIRGVHCTNFGTGTGTFGAGANAECVELNNPYHVIIEKISCVNFTLDDCIHAFGNSSSPPSGAGTFLSILNNHGSGVSRWFIEVQLPLSSSNYGDVLIQGNDADTFTYDTSAMQSGCFISVGIGGGQVTSTPGSAPGTGGIIQNNRASQPSGTHAPVGSIGIEALSNYAIIKNNSIDGAAITNYIGGAHQAWDGNKFLHLPGTPYMLAALIENFNFHVDHNTITNNTFLEPQFGCMALGTGDAGGDIVAGNDCERTPGYWSGDSSVTFVHYSIGQSSTPILFQGNSAILNVPTGGGGFVWTGGIDKNYYGPANIRNNIVWNRNYTATGTGLFATVSDLYSASTVEGNSFIGLSTIRTSGTAPIQYGANMSVPAAQWAYGIYPIGYAIDDPAGHVQKVTTGGVTAGTIPTFNDSGGTTTDGAVTWTDQGVGSIVTDTIIGAGWLPFSASPTSVGCTVNANAGTGATCTITAGDTRFFVVRLVTGLISTLATGEQFRLTFGSTYGLPPYPLCNVTPGDANSATVATLYEGTQGGLGATYAEYLSSAILTSATTYYWVGNCRAPN